MSGADPAPIIRTPQPRIVLRLARLHLPLLILAVVGGVLGCAMHHGQRSEHLGPADQVGFRHDRGEELLARLDCLACHDASPAARARLRPLPAPDLSRVGARRPASWLADFLDAPQDFQHGERQARMPDLLGPLPPARRRAAKEELLHYLVSLGGPMAVPAEPSDGWPIERGGELFLSLGCLPCHQHDLARPPPPGTPSGLTRGYDRSSLASFLKDPLAVRPSGRMPDMALDADAADALACWLLEDRHRRGPGPEVLVPGLRSDEYRVEEGISELPDFDALQPSRSRTVGTVGHEEDEVKDHYAVRLRGELLVPTAGAHTFYTRSDDGSALFIDGRRVVDNDGLHAAQRADGAVTLEAGWHELEVTFFEAGGEARLEAGWVVAADRDEVESDTRPFRPDELRTKARQYLPDGWVALEPEAQLVERGRRRFSSLGCVNCHALDGLTPGPRAPALDELHWLEDGCLATAVRPGLPDNHLDEAERTALRQVLVGAPALEQPLDDALMVDRTLVRLDCLACHARDGAPGPQGPVRAAFHGSADLGDEGRLPPDLSGVGAKLRTGALEEILVGGERVRPYMHARMPRFGEGAVGHLPEAFAAADQDALPLIVTESVAEAGAASGPESRPAPATLDERLAAGRQLAGTGGLSCISCHTVAGQASLGLPGMDLTVMHQRLRSQWFRIWMREPLALRPGTRMPTYFDGDRSVLGSVLDGDAREQISALWDYLALGENLPLPPGVLVDPAAYQLVPVEQPVYVGTFMKGLSARVLNVGFPQKVHIAFDQQHVRLGRAWTGPFLDAEGTWRGRAGQVEQPPGEHVIDLPPGPAFALLPDLDTTPWPEQSGPSAGWWMLGHLRDAEGLPTFRYALGEARGSLTLRVEESPRPLLGEDGPLLVRRFHWTAAPGVSSPVLRAWLGSSSTDTIVPVTGEVGAWEGSDGVRLWLRDAEGFPRHTEHGMELLVLPSAPVFEVVMQW